MAFSIDAFDEGQRTWDWSVYVVGKRIRLQHGVVADGPRCRAWATIGLPFPLALAYAPVMKLALHRLVRGSSLEKPPTS